MTRSHVAFIDTYERQVPRIVPPEAFFVLANVLVILALADAAYVAYLFQQAVSLHNRILFLLLHTELPHQITAWLPDT